MKNAKLDLSFCTGKVLHDFVFPPLTGILPFWDELYPLHGKPRASPRYRDVLNQHLKGARVPYVSWSAWQCPSSCMNENCWWPVSLQLSCPQDSCWWAPYNLLDHNTKGFSVVRGAENGNTCCQTLLTFWKCRQAIPSSTHGYRWGREEACESSTLPPGNDFF